MSRTNGARRLDLTGQRFGKLTVLGPAENIAGRTAWRCRCDCGNEHVVATRYLRNGHSKSCGCTGGGVTNLTYIDGTCVEMLRASTIRSNNTSGVVGVEWRKRDRCWRASICFKGNRYYLGCYKLFDDAVRARKEAEAKTHLAFLAAFDDADPLKGGDETKNAMPTERSAAPVPPVPGEAAPAERGKRPEAASMGSS